MFACYRGCFYSATKREIYSNIGKKHEQMHSRDLFMGSLAVLVAATILQAIKAIVEAVTDDTTARCLLFGCYALTAGQAVGYTLIYRWPSSSRAYQYYYRVASLHCAYAWKSGLSLLLIDTILDEEGVTVAVEWWLYIFIMICIVVVVVSHLQAAYTADQAVLTRAQRFICETFSIGMAYTLSLILLAAMCGINYINILDTTTDDDYNFKDANVYCDPNTQLIVMYPVAVTVLLSVVHSLGLFERVETVLGEGDQNKDEKEMEAAEEEELVRASMVIMRRHSTLMTTLPPPLEHAHEPSSNVIPSQSVQASSPSQPSTLHGDMCLAAIKGQLSSQVPPVVVMASVAMNTSRGDAWVDVIRHYAILYIRPLDVYFCGWDSGRTSSLALALLLYVMFGYFCGSVWFSWSLVSFQFILKGPPVTSNLLFAIVMTYSVRTYLIALTFGYETDVVSSNDNRLTHRRFKKIYLLKVAGRFVVGASWSQVLVELLSLVLSGSRQDPGYVSLRAGVRSVVAVVLFFVGRGFFLRNQAQRKDEINAHEVVHSESVLEDPGIQLNPLM